jgi:hypothetical protein
MVALKVVLMPQKLKEKSIVSSKSNLEPRDELWSELPELMGMWGPNIKFV